MAVALCFVVLVLIVLTQSRGLYAGEINEDKAYTSVMSGVEGIAAADPRVVDMAMLASHNANTYALEEYAGMSGEADTRAARALYRSAWGILYRYTKNQVSDIYDQLCQGVRFLAFRCSYHDGVLCGTHTVVDGPMRPYIQDVIRFLQNAAGELVVLDFCFRESEGCCVADAASALFEIEYNGSTLRDFIPYESVPLGKLTYNRVTDGGTRGGAVILMDMTALHGVDKSVTKAGEYAKKVYIPGWGKERMLTNQWYNRMSVSGIAEGIAAQCERMQKNFAKYQNGFRVMQMQASPTLSDPLETAGAWSLVCNARKHNPEVLANPDFDRWMQYMPVVLCDSVTSSSGGFNQNVNQKITSYNRELVKRLLAETA